MKLTPRLLFYKIDKIRFTKNIWKTRGKFRNPSLKVPEAIQKLGVKIHDPLEEFSPKTEEWKPPVDNDPRFAETPSLTDHPLYNEHPAFSYSYNTRLIQKLDQACALTKSLHFDGLPANVTQLVNKVDVTDKEKLLQHYILHSQEWISTRAKLPKRFDQENLRYRIGREYGVPRKLSMEILLTNLLRLCQSTAAQYPTSLTSRRLIYKPHISTNYSYKGETILIRGTPVHMLGTDKDLQPFVSQEDIDQSAQFSVPDIYPVNPTIDLIKDHIYNDVINTGFKLPYTHSKPHTILFVNMDHWKDIERQSRALMYCFAYAMTRAKEKFGEAVVNLPEPISVQCINMNQTTLNFTCFQLNTLDLDSDNGIKNFVWFDTGNQLYNILLPKPWRKEEPEWLKKRYVDFDTKPFDKMLALILNGLPETANL